MKKQKRASRSVWNDRSVGIAEVEGSNPSSSTKKALIRFSIKKSMFKTFGLETMSRKRI